MIATQLRHNRILSVKKMAEKGRTWSYREMRLLLQIWGEERIQRQLQGVVRNNGFHRTVVQCRGKNKSAKEKV